jgi:hypothetical protein
MRTQDEIVTYIEAHRDDFFGFAREVLTPYLDYEHARPYLKPGTTAEAWDEVRKKDATDDTVRAELADYMQFAWAKVEDHRGLSAGRSVDKCTAWAWLLAGDDVVREIEAAGYAQYGAPKLAVICLRFDLPIPNSTEIGNMIEGRPCVPGCEDGCGR